MAKYKRNTKKIRDVVEFNVNLSCYPKLRTGDRGCRNCEKFLFCKQQEKWSDFEFPRMGLIRRNLSQISHKIAIMAGKGGVGKSILTASVAQALAAKGYRVAVIDQDLDGPSIPIMLGVEGKRLYNTRFGIKPVVTCQGVQVLSTAFFQDVPVFVGYHQRRQELLEEFLARADFGARDFMFIDLPAGTSSDTVNILEYIRDLDGVIIVTIPSEVSLGVARKAGALCQRVGTRILGVVENMSEYVCRSCGHRQEPFGVGGGKALARLLGVPLLACIPLDGGLARSSDEGKLLCESRPESGTVVAISKLVEEIERSIEENYNSDERIKVRGIYLFPSVIGGIVRSDSACNAECLITLKDEPRPDSVFVDVELGDEHEEAAAVASRLGQRIKNEAGLSVTINVLRGGELRARTVGLGGFKARHILDLREGSSLRSAGKPAAQPDSQGSVRAGQ